MHDELGRKVRKGKFKPISGTQFLNAYKNKKI